MSDDLFEPEPAPYVWDFSKMVIKTDPSRSLALYLHNKLYDESVAQRRAYRKKQFVEAMKKRKYGFFPLNEENIKNDR